MHGKCRILDPSSGVGNFLGRLPDEFENSKITAIEKDSLSGRTYQQILQNFTKTNTRLKIALSK